MSTRLTFRLLRLVVLTGLVVGLGLVWVQQSQGNYPVIIERLFEHFQWQLPGEEVEDEFTLSRANLDKQLVELRLSAGLPPLVDNEQLDRAAETVLSELDQDNQPQITRELLDRVYHQVGFVHYQQTTSNFVSGPEFMFATPSSWLTQRIITEDMIDARFNQYGLAYHQITTNPNRYALVFIMAEVKPSSNRGIKPQLTQASTSPQTAQPIAPSMPEISDQSVIEALSRYRADHHVHQLVVDQHLCQYAQKRVQDLLAFGGLDNHAGFKHDFDVQNPADLPEPIQQYSGGAIGENLAYQHCRNMKTGESFVAQTGTALIEWCFDSSTAGHREAQLNPRYNAVCVRHAQGYYVVIFGE